MRMNAVSRVRVPSWTLTVIRRLAAARGEDPSEWCRSVIEAALRRDLTAIGLRGQLRSAKPGALSGGKCAELPSRARQRDGFELVWSRLIERAMATAHMVAADLLPAIDVVKDDPSDNVYLATALAGGARRVVTGSTRLTPHDGLAGLRIVEPAVFLAEPDAQP